MSGRYGNLNPSFRGLGEFLRSPEMQKAMRRPADKIKDTAEADAPVGPPSDQHAGQYKGSFGVESGVMQNAKGDHVAYAKVFNAAPHAVDVEYGGGGRANEPKTSAHHTLTRAIDAARE
jgi:hypothetical protein